MNKSDKPLARMIKERLRRHKLPIKKWKRGHRDTDCRHAKDNKEIR